MKLVIFDCDGTLVDSQHVISSCMAAAWRACGRPSVPDVAAVRRVVGLPLVEAIARLCPEGEAADHALLAEAYKDAFLDMPRGEEHGEPLFPGVVRALDDLAARGFLLGIATGKGRRGLRATLSRHGLIERFVTLQTADDAPGKPRPDMALQALAETGVAAADAVVVGDTIFDMIMAREARVAAIGVGWGYHDKESLEEAGAVTVLESFEELVPTLDNRVWRR